MQIDARAKKKFKWKETFPSRIKRSEKIYEQAK